MAKAPNDILGNALLALSSWCLAQVACGREPEATIVLLEERVATIKEKVLRSRDCPDEPAPQQNA